MSVSDADLIFSLFRARQSIYRLSEKEVAKHGVTLEQATVMRLIKAKNDISIDEICRIMIREHHTISSLIRRMSRKNLVTIKKGERGRIKLALSDKGIEILERVEASRYREGFISMLNVEEKQQLSGYLRRITDAALQKAGKAEARG
ncbi:MarR family transcriptional regulator [Dehalogenimonas sp. 4OHTPN]|uniref:MarR family transcriptional regulator n=1 Tax=Dehalogenimonas sp. 4OHTPN TaxID=3166643 RepID=A0AAU8GB99_9CHLR